MNLDTIKNNIFLISDDFFKETLDIIDYNYKFIDDNELLEPKENYFFSLNFLNTTMNHFINLDNTFCNKTVKKLHIDINNLFKLYQMHKKQSSKIEEIFNQKILHKINLFKEMKDDLNYFSAYSTVEDKETVNIIRKQYTEMQKIYFQYFKDEYFDQVKDISYSLKSIINTKLYYFDKMLWDFANESNIIRLSFKNIDKETKVNGKLYILNRLKIDLPYTDDYKYLKNCLRTYR